jgi:hypothetical protein
MQFGRTIKYFKGDPGPPGADTGAVQAAQAVIAADAATAAAKVASDAVIAANVVITTATDLLNNGTVKAKVGVFTGPVATGNFSVTGLGFKPKTIEFFVSGGPTYQSWFTNCNGFADGLGNQNVSIWTMKGYGQTDVTKCIRIYNSLLVDQLCATLVSMDDGGFTLNFTATTNQTTVRYKAIG